MDERTNGHTDKGQWPLVCGALVIRLHAIILLVHVVRVVAAILEVTAIRIIIAHN